MPSRRRASRCVERHVGVWEGSGTTGRVGRRAAARLAVAERGSLARPATSDFDAVIVGYPGHFDLPAARRAARGRPVIFNPLVSLHETLVEDRGRFARARRRRASLRGSTAAHSARPISSSRTPSRTRAAAPSSAALPRERLAVCFVGAEERALPARMEAAERVPCALRRQADPAARARDDPRGRAARAGDALPASSAAASSMRSCASAPAERRVGRRGSTTSCCRREMHAPAARSASSAPPRRPAA